MDALLNRIIQGDCIAHLQSLPPASVDLAFADPPFNIGYDYDVYDDSVEHQQYIDWSREWIAAVARVLKPNGEIRVSGPKEDTDLDVLFERIAQDLRARMVYDKFEQDYKHVRTINNLRLRPMLYKWTVSDVQELLFKAGFEPTRETDDAYAGQAMIVGARKTPMTLAKVS